MGIANKNRDQLNACFELGVSLAEANLRGEPEAVKPPEATGHISYLDGLVAARIATTEAFKDPVFREDRPNQHLGIALRGLDLATARSIAMNVQDDGTSAETQGVNDGLWAITVGFSQRVQDFMDKLEKRLEIPEPTPPELSDAFVLSGVLLNNASAASLFESTDGLAGFHSPALGHLDNTNLVIPVGNERVDLSPEGREHLIGIMPVASAALPD